MKMKLEMRTIIKIINIMLFYALLSLIFFEVALRLLNYFPPFKPTSYPIETRENAMGIKANLNLPEQDYEGHKGGTIKMPQLKTNHLGQRNDEYSIKKPAEEYRVLCLGDSYTFGWGVKRGETWPDILEYRLQKKMGKPINVINGGRPGRDARGNLNYLLKEGLNLDPDVVIYMILTSDVTREIKYQAALLGEEWALIDDARIMYGKPLVIPADAPLKDKIKLYLRKYSALYYVVRKLVKEGKIEKIPTTKDSINRNASFNLDSTFFSGWDIQSKLIIQMNKACNDTIGFIVAVVHLSTRKGLEVYQEKSNRYLINLLKQNKVNTIDFVNILFEKLNEKPGLYKKLLLNDLHPTSLFYQMFVHSLFELHF